MEENQILTKLFGTIPISDESHLEVLLNQMSKDDALYILIQSVKYSYHQGIFSIGETEVMSKALRILTRENEEKKEG
jgi:hypothetical protein